ncbi:MAG: hypothetical protein ACP5Q0_05405, partial [Halothiobacillus sp.]
PGEPRREPVRPSESWREPVRPGEPRRESLCTSQPRCESLRTGWSLISSMYFVILTGIAGLSGHFS